MQTVSLSDLGAQLLTEARQSRAGRAARTIHGGRDHTLRQTLIAMASGQHLGEHDSPEEATLQVLTGHVRLHFSDRRVWVGHSGQHVVIPQVRHDLTALEDAVVLLTTIVHPHEVADRSHPPT
ncbi:MAG TPA: LuxR family transcriptional regulator [Beutenbergiaceae bacterium]|nr:LuxR family transcriptional regulator [Beutenbergiaceae bacterium]